MDLKLYLRHMVKSLNKPTIISLIIVNFIPLIGVFLFDWDSSDIIYIYWLETGVIGFFSLLKIIYSGLKSNSLLPETLKANLDAYNIPYVIYKLIFLLAFLPGVILTFGLFMWGYFNVLGYLGFIPQDIETDMMYFMITLLALIFSHLFSFYLNFIMKKGYKNITIKTLFMKPYNRIFLLHGFIFVFSIISIYFSIIAPIFFFVIGKIIFDVRAHKKENGI